MKNNFLSKSFENYLCKKLNIKEIEKANLDIVEEITLNAINLNGENEDFDFRDFEKLPNLKFISLKNFIIKNYDTNELNRCKKLEGVQFSNCTFKSKSRLQGSLKLIVIDNCKKFKLKYLSLQKKLEVLKILNLKKINLKDIIYLSNLEKICFENTRIYEIFKLLNLRNLILLKLVNCKYNKRVENLLKPNIEIEK